MITPPTPPSPGRPISASFFSRFIAWVKSCMLIDGVGYRIRRGPNGTSLVIDNKQTISAAPNNNPIFAIREWKGEKTEEEKEEEEEEEEEGKPGKAIVNCFYQLGNIMYHAQDFKWEDDFDDGVLLFKRDSRGACSIVCIPFTIKEDGEYDLEDLLKEQQNQDYIMRPLYIMTGGSVTLDLRCMPLLQAIEMDLK